MVIYSFIFRSYEFDCHIKLRKVNLLRVYEARDDEMRKSDSVKNIKESEGYNSLASY